MTSRLDFSAVLLFIAYIVLCTISTGVATAQHVGRLAPLTGPYQAPSMVARSSETRMRRAFPAVFEEIDGRARPVGYDLQLITLSGDLKALSRSNYGAFELSECAGDDVVCSPHFFDWPYSEATAPDSDYEHGGDMGDGDCDCHLQPELVIQPSIEQFDYPGLTVFGFDPGLSIGAGQDPAEPCNVTISSKSRSRAYNECVFEVHDVNGNYSGNIKIEARLSIYGTPQQTEDPELNSVATWIRQEALAAFSSPAASSISIAGDCPTLTAMDWFLVKPFGSSGFDEIADAENAISSYTSSWIPLTPTGGIPQDQTFSFGFEFVTEGSGAYFEAGPMMFQLRFTPEP